MNREWKQKLSEYVGKGHPDIVADRIADIMNRAAETSATEVIVNQAGCYISGETQFKSIYHETDALNKVEAFLEKIVEDYGKGIFGPDLKTNFVIQNGMLSKRKNQGLSGDQEIVYYHELTSQDVHWHLREIDEKVNAITETYDYKTLVNLYNNTANLSISTSHKDYKEVKKLIVDEIKARFEGIKLSICEFEGGSIFNDTGVTGRKLIVEKAGCGFPHGGGAYFGKDNTKSAVFGHDKLEGKEWDDSLIVYFPGDKLDEPNYIASLGKEK